MYTCIQLKICHLLCKLHYLFLQVTSADSLVCTLQAVMLCISLRTYVRVDAGHPYAVVVLFLSPHL